MEGETDYAAEDLALWERAEDAFFSTAPDEHVEALVYRELALKVLEARTKTCRKAEERLRKALDDLTNARDEMLRATTLAEDTNRLVAMWSDL